MTVTTPDGGQRPGLPSRTSILVAAARALGSREPDESVRNPDHLADLLIGPAELDLISDHPLSKLLSQDPSDGNQNPGVVMFLWFMLLRTRFIDDALERAIKNGATQVVILGAGFDSRAYRFRDLLKHCKVLEIDAAPTQEYKKRRVQQVLADIPPNLIYASIDFSKDGLGDVLQAAGLRREEKTFYIWEGVSMYLPENGVRETLRIVASYSAPGSSLVLDYANRLGIEMARTQAQGTSVFAQAWGEPWIFGVPDSDGVEFFRELGFDPGVPVSTTNRDIIKRYTMRRDGALYGEPVFQKMRAEAQARAQAAASSASEQQADAWKARATEGLYWLAELTVPAPAR
ncbi:MAG TPA: SAM-dependent methyltransferase [Bryobacteraceae bacterium]|nr:SAM-dependent methyltransferase [Bryobacteraceae bacterium]